MPGEAMRVGLVGCGRLAEVGYVPAFRAARGMTLVAVAEPDHGRRRQIADLAGGVPAFAGLAELLGETAVDGVVLASPAGCHVADARAATAAAVAVLVEKPPAPDARSAAELAALTPAPWIGFNRRFDSRIADLRAAIRPGAPAELRLELSYRRSGWGAHTVSDDAVVDLGPHVVDLARWLACREVTGVRHAVIDGDRAAIELELGETRAGIRIATDEPYRELAELRDSRGVVIGRHRRGGVRAALRDRVRRSPHPLAVSLRAQLEAFGQAAAGESESILARAEDGAAVMTVIETVREAAKQNRAVPVEPEI